MYILKKKLRPTCTAHYLGKDYPRACKNLHGHNYNYEIEVGIDDLNKYDMGIDFSQIKTICDDYLQRNYDHKTLFSDFQEKAMGFWQEMGWEYTVLPRQDANTTAENMAYCLAYEFAHQLLLVCPSIRYVTVTVQETEGSKASYTYRRTIDEI